MNKIIISLIVLVLLIGCEPKNSLIPFFKGNHRLSDDDYNENMIRTLTEGKEFSIAFATSGGFRTLEYSVKAFCIKNGIGEKAEYRTGITEIDTAYSETNKDIVYKEIIFRKECRKEETQQFFNQLTKFKLFELKEWEELAKACKDSRTDHRIPLHEDAGSVTFYLVQGNKVRMLRFPFLDEKDCPSISEDLNNIIQIKSLFEREWYIKKHY